MLSSKYDPVRQSVRTVEFPYLQVVAVPLAERYVILESRVARE